MIDKPISFVVSAYTQRNHATSPYNNVTDNETTLQPPSLLSLASKVLERNKYNKGYNPLATSQLQRHDNDNSNTPISVNIKSCTVALPIECNYATHSHCIKCGYNNPFCSCNIIPPGMVTCNRCEHFTADIIGDGAGIGSCGLEVKWTQEVHGKMPLFRYSTRNCSHFSKLMS